MSLPFPYGPCAWRVEKLISKRLKGRVSRSHVDVVSMGFEDVFGGWFSVVLRACGGPGGAAQGLAGQVVVGALGT